MEQRIQYLLYKLEEIGLTKEERRELERLQKMKYEEA